MTTERQQVSTSDYLALLSISSTISREPNLDGLLQSILAMSMPWIQCEACSIFLPDEVTGDLEIHSAQGGAADKLKKYRIPAGQGIVGTAMMQKKTVRVDNVGEDSRFFKAADKESGWSTRALIAAPLLDGELCIGAIEFLNPINRPSFTQHDETLIEYFSNLVSASLVRIQSHQMALAQVQMQRDLDLAREMQSGLLPKNYPPCNSTGDLNLFAALRPALEVSGDLYDFFGMDQDRQYFLLGDVSGKGIAAGLFMAVTRTLIRATARQHESPVDILRQVNEQLFAENPAFLFVTILLGFYDRKTGIIEYAQGGHNQAVLIDNSGKASYQPSGGQPLGVFANASFQPLTCKLEPGESFVIYSDGVTEAMNNSQKTYSNSRLEMLLQNCHDIEAKKITERILSDVDLYVDGAEQSDDITLLVLHRKS
jgi:sigma-B regulation protein RsbU (phosphoserine phosphatase)